MLGTLQTTSAYNGGMMQSKSIILNLALMFALLFSINAGEVSAQQQSLSNNASNVTAVPSADTSAKAAAAAPSVEDRLKALEQVIEQQQREIQALHELIEKHGTDNANTRAEAVTG